jgi:hypothetical protein
MICNCATDKEEREKQSRIYQRVSFGLSVITAIALSIIFSDNSILKFGNYI